MSGKPEAAALMRALERPNGKLSGAVDASTRLDTPPVKLHRSAGSPPPGHVELLNLMARALGHRNLQSLQAGEWKPGEARANTLVFIGKHLDRAALTEGFKACLAG